MSIEVLTTMISFAGLLFAIGGGFAWSVKRTDAQVQALRDEMRSGDRALRDDVAEVRDEVAAVREELIAVKVAVARLEGPTPRLITAR